MSKAFLGSILISIAFCVSELPAAELLPVDKPIAEAIDHYVDAKLDTVNLKPAPQANDANLVRRLMLDLAGRIPAPIEAKQFIDSTDTDKRVQVVDRLMATPEFVDHMANRFDVMLMSDTGASVRDYLKTAFEENRSWDRVFRELLLPDQKDEKLKTAAEFVKRRANDADQLTVDVSSMFFGVNVSCAKCHDHPEVSDWTQDYYYGMKSFFNRTFESGGFVAEREYGLVKYKTKSGEERDAKLMFISGTVLDEPEYKEPSKDEEKAIEDRLKELAKNKQAPPEPEYSRRARLIEIALKPEQNEYFARAIVNRVWHQFLGYGLVMPLDQMHEENPASHPQLLEWLARDLISHHYDLRRLVRGIVLSQAYSRSSQWDSEERPSSDLFAVAEVRPLTPIQYARSLSLATADPQSFEGDMSDADRQQRIAGSAGTGNSNQFQQPGDNFQVSADEALFFSNSDQVERSYLNGGLFRRLKDTPDQKQMIETAVWSIFARPPADEEIEILSKYVEPRADRHDDACRQLIWALLTSSEFRFNY